MKKKIFTLIVGIISVISMTGLASATGPTAATSTSWGAGSTISTSWLNAVGSLLSTLSTIINSTSTPLGTISTQATTTGNILVASTTKGWVALAVGSNGQCPVASSTAPLGIAWGTCITSVNGTASTSFQLNGTSNQVIVTQTPSGTFTFSTPQSIGTISSPQFFTLGVGTANTSNGIVIGGTPASSGALSELSLSQTLSSGPNKNALGANFSTNFDANFTNTTGSIYAQSYYESSTVLNNTGNGTLENDQIYVNGPVNGTSTNGSYAIHVASGTSQFDGTLIASGTFKLTKTTSSILYATTTGQVQSLGIGSGLTLLNGSLSANAASVAGSDCQVQFNNGGSFGATSTLCFTSSTQNLTLNNASSNVQIGSQFYTSKSFSYTGTSTTWTSPNVTTTVTVSATGGHGGSNSTAPGGAASVVAGTFTASPNTLYFISVGAMGTTSISGTFPNGGAASGTTKSGAGGGMTWMSPTSTFSTTTIIIAAGAGAGSGTGFSGGGGANGGDAGYPQGTVGATGNATGANPGTQTAGGTNPGSVGTAGQLAKGGNGGGGASTGGGGGGGDGCYGGGGADGSGGGTGGGGGGGSSCFGTTLSATSSATSSALVNGSLTLIFAGPTTTAPFALAVAGHITTGGLLPTVTSCGTGASIIGNDTAGQVTVGSGSQASCQINFAQTYQNTLICPQPMVASGTAVAFKYSQGTTSTVFTSASSMAGGTIFTYGLCNSY